jgi:hypothetical protein
VVAAWLSPIVALVPTYSCAFVLLPQPPGNRLVMNLNVQPTTPFQTIGYGTQSWNSLAEGALSRWNGVGIGVGQDHGFFSVRAPATVGDPCARDGINEVRAAATNCGLGWGSGIAITKTWLIGGTAVESDVIFNSLLPYNAYTGPTLPAASGGPLIDFFRLALHEFGHAASLGHPDAAGQKVVAVMNQGNQQVGGPQSAVDDLQPDDIAGAHAIAFGASLATAVLPGSRSVMVGVPATVFATIINASSFNALNVGMSLATTIPASFAFQTTNPATNQLTGFPNVPVNIGPGQAQSFVISITPTAPISAGDVAFTFAGSNTFGAGTLIGINTLFLSASSSPVPDVIALAATLNNDGIVNIPGTMGTGVFSVATSNVGAGGSITASADTGSAALPITLTVCQTNPTTGVCLAPPAASVTTTINAGATPTFGIFVRGNGTVAFNPATNRVFMRFKDSGGVTRGATSVAVRTQ